MRISVLGAGYMGSALATLARFRGHSVRLWGTPLDTELLDVCARGEPHPRLRLPLPGVELFRAEWIAEALDGAELVVHAANSDGLEPVLAAAAPYLPDVPILSVTKGLRETRSSQTMETLDRIAADVVGRRVRFVHAAGPAKAVEVARGVYTRLVFAGSRGDAELCTAALGGDHVRAEVTLDLTGAELCSAFKNAYATGLGLWDGVGGADVHNARAAGFTHAIEEMARLVVAGGGCVETVYGAAGVGDLHVTAAAGRNRAFGERVGRGGRPKDVAAAMAASGELTEGYAAIAAAHRFARERGVTDVPFLAALHAIVWEDAEIGRTLARFAGQSRA